MRDFYTKLECDGKEYILAFDLNVMEAIQEEYETLDKWQSLIYPKKGEPNMKAMIFGFTEMLNEGLDIESEKTNVTYKPFTKKQVGRLLTAIGLENASEKMGDAIVKANEDDSSKNV